MSNRLSALRSQLAGLSQARAGVRAVAAWSALATACIVALAAFFALDLIFELAVLQRVVVLLLASGALAWAFWRFTRPLLGIRETEIDMALLVERQQRIDSDLVAALQFEQPEAHTWGSPQLATAVVEYVAATGRGINVYGGFSRRQMMRRLGLLGVGLAAALLTAAIWPAHMAALLNRLLLGPAHYPTRTRIEQVVVNSTSVLIRRQHGSTPEDSKCAQGQPLSFLVQCAGQTPNVALAQLSAADSSRSRTRLALKPLTLAERLSRLQAALGKLTEASQQEASRVLPPWRDEIHSLVRFDAPGAVAPLLAAKGTADLAAVAAAVTEAMQDWPGDHVRTTVLAGELGRLNENLTYKIVAGDAWTDTAAVQMIPLPLVELRLTPVPPKYAQTAAENPDSAGRQLAVLEGSSIELTAECTNRKRLQAAWLAVQAKDAVQQYDLQPRDDSGLVWALTASDSPLKNVRRDLQYELQVQDGDGLSLQTPIRGLIRIRPDHPPTGLAEVIHKVVLPAAEPVVEYRASDDYGISRLALLVEVQRGAGPVTTPAAAAAPAESSATSTTPAVAVAAETHRCSIYDGPEPLTGEQLPRIGKYALALAPYSLAKGDRIKLTLEVTDHRGENERQEPRGIAYQSDPLVLEISDEAGVLAAISQADPNSEERLTDIIKRQLGIGESP
jgi:hypothetical protein